MEHWQAADIAGLGLLQLKLVHSHLTGILWHCMQSIHIFLRVVRI